MNSPIALEIADGPLRGRHPAIRLRDGLRFNQEAITLPQPAILRVGRALDCQICLPADDDQVSRQHFLLEVRDSGVRVRDCGSRNGTFVNGVELARAVVPDPAWPAPESRPSALELKDGDHILAGQTVFRVRIADCAVQDSFVLHLQHEIVPPRVEVHEESFPNPRSHVAPLSRRGVPAERRSLSEEEHDGALPRRRDAEIRGEGEREGHPNGPGQACPVADADDGRASENASARLFRRLLFATGLIKCPSAHS